MRSASKHAETSPKQQCVLRVGTPFHGSIPGPDDEALLTWPDFGCEGMLSFLLLYFSFCKAVPGAHSGHVPDCEGLDGKLHLLIFLLSPNRVQLTCFPLVSEESLLKSASSGAKGSVAHSPSMLPYMLTENSQWCRVACSHCTACTRACTCPLFETKASKADRL